MEKNDIVLKQFEKEIKQNGDLNSSKSKALNLKSLQFDSNLEGKLVNSVL